MSVLATDQVFLGVSTASSAAVGCFPAWAAAVGLKDAQLRLVDLPVGVDPSAYESFLESVRNDPSVAGALVTTHKAGMFDRCGRTFDALEPESRTLAEVGVIYRDDERMVGGSSDVQAGRLVLARLLSTPQWTNGERSVCVLGGGGAGMAAAYSFAAGPSYSDGAAQILVLESDELRARQLQRVVSQRVFGGRVKVLQSAGVEHTQQVVASLGTGALLINATGMGKDRAGSPIQDASSIPPGSVVWEFNYRGDLDFLRLCEEVVTTSDLVVEDGFAYFAAGWMTVMSKVYHFHANRELFDEFRTIASTEIGERH